MVKLVATSWLIGLMDKLMVNWWLALMTSGCGFMAEIDGELMDKSGSYWVLYMVHDG